MKMSSDNFNCRGCGALLTAYVCSYCKRPVQQGDKITRDSKDDPKRNIEPRKEEK